MREKGVKIFLLLAIVFIFGSKNKFAYAASVSGDYEYELINNGEEVRITKYIGDKKNVYIPSTIEGKKVTELGSQSFRDNDNIVSISTKLASNLVTINEGAFEDCDKLETVVMGNGLKYLGSRAFKNCKSLKNVTMGKNLIVIHSEAFYNCDRLESIICSFNLESISNEAFYDCDGLKNITFNKKLEGIGQGAFYDCDNLEKVVIPDSVRYIHDGSWWTDNGAFGHCDKLKTVVIGNGLKYLGLGIFKECRLLENVVIGNKVESINRQAFYNCDSLKSIVFNDNLQEIGEGAFYDCDNLESVIIPDSVKLIKSDSYGSYQRGLETFGDCDKLKTVVIGNNVKYINPGTFNGCKSLENITIGNSVKMIKNYAFYNCPNLSKLYFRGNAPTINSYAFYNNSSKLTFYYKSDATGFSNIRYNTQIFDSNKTHKTVTFKTNGGSGSDVKISTIKGSTVYMPKQPTRKGYTFVGWYFNSNGTGLAWDFNNTVDNNITLYAKWQNRLSSPTNVKVEKVSTSSMKVSWNPVNGATKYSIYRSTSKTGAYLKVGESTTTDYTSYNVPRGKVYYYKVRAVGSDTLANSQCSSVVSFYLK